MKSFSDLLSALPDEQAAVDLFSRIRWKHGAFCPYCGSTTVFHFVDGLTHKCGECRRRFSVKVGTIFEGSRTGLRQWILAIWLICQHQKLIPSTHLADKIGVTQKTAWTMLRRLGLAMHTRSFHQPFSGDTVAEQRLSELPPSRDALPSKEMTP